MIPNFYPTVTDKISIMGMAFTAELQSIPVADPEFTQAYWLGWMRWDNLPLQYHVSRATFENGTLTFTDITKPENVPVGFSIHNKTYYDVYQFGASEVKYNGTKWAAADYVYSSGAPTNFYLPNSLDINVLSWGRLRLIYLAMSVDRSIVLESIVSDVPYADFAAGNNMIAKVLDGGSFRNQTFTVTKDDISSHAMFQKEINGTVFDIVLASYTVPYNRDVRFNDSVDDYAAVHPMIKVHTTEDTPYVSGITNPVQYQFRDDCGWGSGYLGQGFFSNWSGMVDRLSSSRITDVIWDRFGGFVGSFKVSDLAPFARDLFVPEGATFYVRGIERNDINIIGRVLTYDEILHCLSLLPRMQDTNINRYEQNASYWYGHVDYETNEFLGDLVNGSQLNKLVDWQLLNHNIVDNDFTEDKIPEYVPPEGELPDAYGSDVLPDLNLQIGAIGGFITQYCMTASQVASFGSYLWANIFSIEFLQSVGTMIANDFSINPSDILKYIVSLRCYPFDLANVQGFNSDPDTIYFGRGVVGIPSAGIGTMDNLVTTFGGEYITVPRLKNDFRDYEPYTRISLNIPFCGQVELTPSEVVGKNIFISYTVDFSAGTVQANVWVNAEVAYIIASASGSIGANIQISASNGMEFLQKIGSSVASFVKTVGTVAAIAATAGAVSDAIGVEASEPLLTQAEFSAIQSKATANAVQAGAGITGALVSSPEASSLPIHSKSVGGGFTSFSTPKAYLIVERRKYVIPSNYNHVYGKACNFTTTLDQVKGFTVCKNVDLEGFPATQDELAAIESLLSSGVYF